MLGRKGRRLLCAAGLVMKVVVAIEVVPAADDASTDAGRVSTLIGHVRRHAGERQQVPAERRRGLVELEALEQVPES